jgi:hypothetical protein
MCLHVQQLVTRPPSSVLLPLLRPRYSSALASSTPPCSPQQQPHPLITKPHKHSWTRSNPPQVCPASQA